MSDLSMSIEQGLTIEGQSVKPKPEVSPSPENETVIRSWEKIEEIAKKNTPAGQEQSEEEHGIRQLSVTDKVRRQGLLLQARMERVSNLNSFNALVDYLESTVVETGYKEIKVRKGLSEDEKQRILEGWKAKGYRGDIYSFHEYDSDKQAELSLRYDYPLQIKRENIGPLKNLITSNNDPVGLMKDLRKMGFYATEWKLKDRAYMQKVGQLFAAPHAKEAIELASGISRWGSEWLPQDGYSRRAGREVGHIDFLINLANSPDPKSVFPPDLVQKIDTLSTALKMRVGAAEIEQLKLIMANPQYLELASYIAGDITASSGYGYDVPVYENILALDKAGLIKPLLALHRSGIQFWAPGQIPPGMPYEKLFNSWEAEKNPEVTRTEATQTLTNILADSEIQTFVNDPQRREYAKELTRLVGYSPNLNFLPTINSTFPQRADVINLYNFFTRVVQDRPNLNEFISFVKESPEVVSVYTDPKFSEFLQQLQEKVGYIPNRYEIYNKGEDNKILKLYKDESLREGILKDETAAIIRAIRKDRRFNLEDALWYTRLASIPHSLEAINALNGLGYNFSYGYLEQAIEYIAKVPEVLEKLSSQEAANLVKRLKEEFRYDISGQDIQNFVDLLDDKDTQAELFKPEIIEFIHKIRPHGIIHWPDIKAILAMDSPTRELLAKLSDEFNFSPFFGASGLHGNDIFTNLLANNELREQLFSPRIVQAVRRLQEEFNYGNFEFNDIQTIINLSDGFVDFVAFMQDRYQYKFQKNDLKTLVQLSANREGFPASTIEGLTVYGYQLKLADIPHLNVLTPHIDELRDVLNVLSTSLGHVFNIGYTGTYLKLINTPGLAERIKATEGVIDKGELANQNNFRLFVNLQCDANVYNHAKKLLEDDYFKNIRDASNRITQFLNSLYREELPAPAVAKIFTISTKATELDRLALKLGVNVEIAKAANREDWYGPLLEASNFQETSDALTRLMTELAIPAIYTDLQDAALAQKQNELLQLASTDKEFGDILDICCRSVGIYGQKYGIDQGNFDIIMGGIRQALELNLERNPRAYLQKRAELSAHQFDRIFEGFPQEVRGKVLQSWLDLSSTRRLRVSGEVVTAEEVTLNRLNRIKDIVQTDLSVHLEELFLTKIKELEQAQQQGDIDAPGAEQLAIYRQYLLTPEGILRKDIPSLYRSVETFIRSSQQALKNPGVAKEEKVRLGKSLGTYQAISDSLEALYRLGTISEKRYKARRDYVNEMDKYIGEFSGALKKLRILDPERRATDVNTRALEEEVLLDFGKLRGTMTEEGISGQTAMETVSTVTFRDLARAPEMTLSCQRLTEVTGYNHAAYSRLLDGSNEMIDIYELRNGEKNRLARSFIELSRVNIAGENQPRLAILIDREYVNPQYQNFSLQFSKEMITHMLDRINVVPEVSLLFDSYRIGATPEVEEILKARGYQMRQVSGEYLINESNVKLQKYYDSMGGAIDVSRPYYRPFGGFYIVEKAA